MPFALCLTLAWPFTRLKCAARLPPALDRSPLLPCEPDIFSITESIRPGYVLSYTADAAAGNDFHPVEVSVNQANTQLMQSAGYFPYEGTLKSSTSEDVGMALKSSLEFTGVASKVAVAGIEAGAAGKKKVNLVITLSGDCGVLNETSGTVDAGLIAKAINSAGQAVGSMSEGAGGKFSTRAGGSDQGNGLPAQAFLRGLGRGLHRPLPRPRQSDRKVRRRHLSA